MGYHKSPIERGTYGDASKIIEECMEFKDAVEQKCALLQLIELSDMVGAIEGYLKKHHPSIDLTDLIKMAHLTQSAFEDGHRK